MAPSENPYVVSSWYLSETLNQNTGKKILFSYQDVNTETNHSKMITHTRDLPLLPPSNYTWVKYSRDPVLAENTSWDYELLNKLPAKSTNILYSRSLMKTKRLSAITLPNGGLITFLYGAERVDLKGENALEKIVYTNNNTLVRAYDLKYGYLFKNNVRDYNSYFSGFEKKFARLCLLSLQKIGNGKDDAVEPAYQFKYYMGDAKRGDDIVPALNFLSIDHGGYFNGDVSNLPLDQDHDDLSQPQDRYFRATLPTLKAVKNGYAKNGLLRAIIYPTGGSLTYYYDQILSYGFATNRPVPGVSVSKTVMHDADSPEKDIVNEYKFMKTNGRSSYWGFDNPVYYGLSGNQYILVAHDKKYKYPALEYAEMATSVDWGKAIGKAIIGAVIGAGISYLISLLPATVAPVINIILFAVTVVQIIFTVFSSDYYFYGTYTLSNVNYRLSNSMGNHYSYVEVRSNSPGGGYTGKTVYEFTNKADYQPFIPVLDWPYPQYQRLASWVYDNPRKISVYDAQNKLIKESNNYYNNIVEDLAGANTNCKCEALIKYSMVGRKWEGMENTHFTSNQHKSTLPRFYNFKSGRTDLAGSNEKAFINNLLYSSIDALYATDAATLLQKGSITRKDPLSFLLKVNFYPTDYTIANSALEKMKTLNMIHVPVATETWQLRFTSISPNGNLSGPAMLELVNSNITEYKLYTFNGRQEVRVWRNWGLKSRNPIPVANIGMHSQSALIRNPSYFKLENELQYDGEGNLVQKISNNNNTSFINDYSERYVTATVANATYSNIAYSSFEANGTGNWNFNFSAVQQNDGYTGTKSFKFGVAGGISKTGLSSSKSYLVTYWQKNNSGAISVNGQTGQVLYEANGWKLYEVTISNSTTVTLSGTGIIDELRLHPTEALMSTVTYEEGIGKVAECDANNRAMFYEYDALGRLKIVRDQNRNIIKTYEYNYKQ